MIKNMTASGYAKIFACAVSIDRDRASWNVTFCPPCMSSIILVRYLPLVMDPDQTVGQLVTSFQPIESFVHNNMFWLSSNISLELYSFRTHVRM